MRISFRAKICLFLLRTAGKLPLRFLYGVGGVVAWFLERVLHYRRDVIVANLARSFPERDYRWVTATAHEYYGRIGDIFAETVWFGGCTGDRGRARLRRQHLYEYTNSEVMLDLHRERGVMIMKSHAGNWEVFGGIYEYDYRNDLKTLFDQNDMHVVYRRLRDGVSDQVFYENRHAPLPDYRGLTESGDLMRDAIRRRNERPVYLLNTDQYPYKAGHHVGTFLNQDTEGMLGGFSLAVKLGFAVIYQREERVSRGHYTLTYEVITPDATGRDAEELMRRYFALLEADVRRDPVNYLWSHKRWHKP